MFTIPVVLWPSEMPAILALKGAWKSRMAALGAAWSRSNRPSFEAARERWLENNQRLTLPPGDAETTSLAATLAMYSERGRDNEARAVKALQDEGFLGELHRNVACWWSSDDAPRPVCDVASINVHRASPYRFHGELDAVTSAPDADGKRNFLEFKLRFGGLEDVVPPGDVAQVRAYLMMTQYDYAVLHEHVHGSGGVGRTTRIDRDDATWSRDYKPHVEQFVCDVRRCMRGALADESLRQAVLDAYCRRDIPPPVAAALQLVDVPIPEPVEPPEPSPERPARPLKTHHAPKAPKPALAPLAPLPPPPPTTRSPPPPPAVKRKARAVAKRVRECAPLPLVPSQLMK